MVRRIKSVLDTHGLAGLLMAIGWRLFAPKARSFGTCAKLLQGRIGLEIGGPSSIFSRGGRLPLYPLVDRLDNCNFSSATVWEGRITQGLTFQYDKKRPSGRQYIAEATDLELVPAAAYDFVLSSHTIEHTANPVRALHEWMRIIKDSGALVLVVPHKEGTFDHRRPVTPLAHLIEDWTRGTTEEDLTHLGEILALHDLSRDPGAGDPATFKTRSERNKENRCLHHHVFDTSLVVELTDHVGMQILAVEPLRPFHIILIAQKVKPEERARNEVFRGEAADYRTKSPFQIDRIFSPKAAA